MPVNHSKAWKNRNERLHAGVSDATPTSSESRSPAERDRDRLLHCSALRRLAGVTQVAGAGEADVFHNRLTHTLKVAQIGQRIAERLNHIHGGLADDFGGLDPSVVEAAALAHDLGHPPFGHAGEEELGRLVKEFGNEDSFEGNAQSFRIVTKLAFRRDDHPGQLF